MPIPVPLAAAGIAAGAGLLGGAVTSALNVHEARASRRQARDMANTEMQRRVADLRKANLNPMLAVQGAGGVGHASSPATSAAHLESPRGIDPLVGAQLMESHARTAKDLAEVGKVKSETSFLNESMADRLNMAFVQLQHEMMKKDLTRAEQEMLVSRMVMIEQEFEKLKLETTHSALDLDRMRAESALYKTLGGFGAAGKMGLHRGLLRIPGAALGRSKGVTSKVFKRGSRGNPTSAKQLSGKPSAYEREVQRKVPPYWDRGFNKALKKYVEGGD